MLIAQITDLHIAIDDRRRFGRLDTHALAERTIAALLALVPRPDVVLVTGDVVDEGLAEEYERAAKLLARLPMPVYAIPGNHDDRSLMRGLLPGTLGSAKDGPFLHYAVEGWPIRLVGLDSKVPGTSAGALCEARLDWLESKLAGAPEQPTLLFLHHPPFACGMPFMDRVRLTDGAARLEAIVAANPQVLALVCGHHHRPMDTLFGGRPCHVTPGTAHQVALSLGDPGPARIVLEPPALRLLNWDGRRLVSHLLPVERYPAPAAPAPLAAAHA